MRPHYKADDEEGRVEGADGGAAADAAAPLARTSSEMERKLLEFESELDATMLRLRKNLMVIRLLGLMSEDEELQDQLMKDSSRLLDFICITLNRGAAIAVARKERRDTRRSCKSEQELDEDEDEDYGSVMLETQSLNTALTLLAFKVRLLGNSLIFTSESSLMNLEF